MHILPTYSVQHPIGWAAPDFSLHITSKRIVSLADFQNSPSLLIIFISTNCVYSKAAWPILKKLHDLYGKKTRFLAVHPGASKHNVALVQDQMQAMTVEYNLLFPYLYDSGNKVAKAFGAVCTPEPFLFKNTVSVFSVFYHGRITEDLFHKDATSVHDLQRALEQVQHGDNPSTVQHPAVGCALAGEE